MSRYAVYITPRALREIKNLPGHMRQRVKHAIDELADDPHPLKTLEDSKSSKIFGFASPAT